MANSRDRITKVKFSRKPGFLERIGNSCSGILFGVIFLFISSVILYYNEEKAVRETQVIDDAIQRVATLDLRNVNGYDSELVHHTGLLQIKKNSEDLEFGISVPCVVLRRNVEMFQWVEHSDTKEETVGNEIKKTSTYTYDTEWSNTLIKSRNFEEEIGHQNPSEIFINKMEHTASEVTIDGIHLSQNLISKIKWFKSLEMLPTPSIDSRAKLFKNYYYFGADPLLPEVGDIRVSFECAGFTDSSFNGIRTIVSVIARLDQNSFQNFVSPHGGSIELLYQGSLSAEDILTAEQTSLNMMTWFFRLLGCILMYIGMSISTKIVVTLVSWIPLVRDIVSVSVTVFNITIAFSLSLIIISLSWIRFRPMFATTVAFLSISPWFLSKLGTSSTRASTIIR